MTEDDVRALLRRKAKPFAKTRTGGVGNWCIHHGLSQGYVSQFLNGQKSAGPKILDALGLEVIYRRRAK